jgi:peptide/nickel transport system permease protein
VPRWLRGNRSLQLGLLVLTPFLLMVLFPGAIAPHGPNELLGAPFQRPSSHYLLGTDEVGRDLLSRLIYGARTDLGISLGATIVAAVLGTLIGLLAGYVGSFADVLAMRATDVVLSFPSILFAIFLITIVGRGSFVLAAALVVLFIPAFVRLSRGLAIGLRERGFVEASVVSGGGPFHVLTRHLLPNAAGPIIVGCALTASTSLLTAASLSYLGVGVQPPTSSWGNMLQTSFQWLFQDPLYGVMPGVCITLVALGYTWVADGVQHAMGGGDIPVRTVRALAEGLSVSPAGEAEG